MMTTRRAAATSIVLLAIGGACAPTSHFAARRVEKLAAVSAPAPGVHGRVESPGGLRLLRLWGTPEERGYAHGFLLAEDIIANLGKEFSSQFAQRPSMLEQARRALPRLIDYPDDYDRELDALWRVSSPRLRS